MNGDGLNVGEIDDRQLFQRVQGRRTDCQSDQVRERREGEGVDGVEGVRSNCEGTDSIQ